jgi:predicted RNA methylase
VDRRGRRAARLAAAGVTTIADLGCGLGSDALAAARAGIRVYAVDADPLTAMTPPRTPPRPDWPSW